MSAFNTRLHVVGGQQTFIGLFTGHFIELYVDIHYLTGDYIGDELPCTISHPPVELDGMGFAPAPGRTDPGIFSSLI
jgi:hypothetical protein